MMPLNSFVILLYVLYLKLSRFKSQYPGNILSHWFFKILFSWPILCVIDTRCTDWDHTTLDKRFAVKYRELQYMLDKKYFTQHNYKLSINSVQNSWIFVTIQHPLFYHILLSLRTFQCFSNPFSVIVYIIKFMKTVM